MTTLRGTAIRFNELSEILVTPVGNFREKIAPRALDRTLNDPTSDLRGLFNHDPARLLGRQGAGTLRVSKTARGLEFELDAPGGPTGQDVVEAVRRHDANGCSFAFQSLADEWEDHGAMPVRTVTDMLLREISVVTWPCYPQTSVALRAAPASPESWQRHGPRPTTVAALLTEALERRSMEYALTRGADGAPVLHSEAAHSLRRYLDAKKAAGRRPTAHGAPMAWRSTRTAAGWTGKWVARRTVADCELRLAEQARRLRLRGAYR